MSLVSGSQPEDEIYRRFVEGCGEAALILREADGAVIVTAANRAARLFFEDAVQGSVAVPPSLMARLAQGHLVSQNQQAEQSFQWPGDAGNPAYRGSVQSLASLCGGAPVSLVRLREDLEMVALPERSYWRAADALNTYVIEVELDGRVRIVNSRVQSALMNGGILPADASIMNLPFIEDDKAVQKTLAALIQEASQRRIAKDMICLTMNETTTVFLDTVATPVFDTMGRVDRVLITGVDVTAYVDAQEALRQTELRYNLATDGLQATLWEWDVASDVFVLSGRSGLSITGHEEDQVMTGDEFISNYVHRDDRALLSAALRRLILEDRRYSLEHRLFTVDGSCTWVQSAAMAERNEQGHAVRVVGFATDITHRKHAEFALIEARHAAEAANKAKSEFLAVMSHEIRTPMNGVLGMAALLADMPLEPAQRVFVENIQSSGQALITIINDILDLSKLDAERMELEAVPFDLPLLVSQVGDTFRPQADQKELRFTITIGQGVPRAILGDPVRLRQILTNLIGNAFKFTHEGGVDLEVVGIEGEDPVLLTFSIGDTGIGISEDAQKRLFEAFSQADTSTTRKYGGTGLGLVITRKLTDLMGGSVSLTSAEGHGTTFTVTIPFNLAAPEDVPAQGAFADHAAPSGLVKGTEDVPAPPIAEDAPHILLAEDNVTNRLLFRTLLERTGYRVDEVENGREALDYLSHTLPDLVLMDIQMPEMDGMEATRCIRAMETPAAGLPIIAITANAMTGDRERYIAAGMDDYVAKPIDAKAFLLTVEEMLGASAATGRASLSGGAGQKETVDGKQSAVLSSLIASLEPKGAA